MGSQYTALQHRRNPLRHVHSHVCRVFDNHVIAIVFL